MSSSVMTPAFRKLVEHDMLHEHRLGFRLPKDRSILIEWTKHIMDRVRASPPKAVHWTLLALKKLVYQDKFLKPLSESMFTEVPNIPEYMNDPEGNRQLKSFDDMINAFDLLLHEGPVWSVIANKVGLIGCPFNCILDWPMATASGYMFFLIPSVNQALGAMLHQWEHFLKSDASTKVFQDQPGPPPSLGWFSSEPGGGLDPLIQMFNSDPGVQQVSKLSDAFQCPDPDDPKTYGFACWEDFFTREINEDVRPLAGADNDPKTDPIIVHACESAPLQYPVSNVQRTDNFMGKNQKYSLMDMMNGHKHADDFIGGTVYQAFLSCLSYHRWRSPVAGTIVDTEVVSGTYYSQNIYQTFFGHLPASATDQPDPAGPTWSQPYIASVAARGLIFIQADNPAIGLVCFIGIGMSDTSGVEFCVKKDDKIGKGDVLGMFHFGGSSHCLIFQPGVELQWDGIPPDGDPRYPVVPDVPNGGDDPGVIMPNFPVRSLLAKVTSTAP